MLRALALPFTVAIMTSMVLPAMSDHGVNFHCERMPFLSENAKTAIERLSHNDGMRKIVSFYAWQWENEEMRRICDAGAARKAVDTSCLEGRRDWDTIASKIPEGLTGKSNTDLRPHMLELASRGYHTTERRDAMRYCAHLGVVDEAFK